MKNLEGIEVQGKVLDDLRNDIDSMIQHSRVSLNEVSLDASMISSNLQQSGIDKEYADTIDSLVGSQYDAIRVRDIIIIFFEYDNKKEIERVDQLRNSEYQWISSEDIDLSSLSTSLSLEIQKGHRLYQLYSGDLLRATIVVKGDKILSIDGEESLGAIDPWILNSSVLDNKVHDLQLQNSDFMIDKINQMRKLEEIEVLNRIGVFTLEYLGADKYREFLTFLYQIEDYIHFLIKRDSNRGRIAKIIDNRDIKADFEFLGYEDSSITLSQEEFESNSSDTRYHYGDVTLSLGKKTPEIVTGDLYVLTKDLMSTGLPRRVNGNIYIEGSGSLNGLRLPVHCYRDVVFSGNVDISNTVISPDFHGKIILNELSTENYKKLLARYLGDIPSYIIIKRVDGPVRRFLANIIPLSEKY